MRPNRSMLIFATIVSLISGMACWFCGSQLAKAFPLGGTGVWAAWAWATVLWAFPVSRAIFFRNSTSPIQGLAFFMMGLGATFLILLLLLGASGLVLGFFGWMWPRWAPWPVLGAAVVLSVWGLQAAFSAATVRKIPITIPSLHPGLDGLRIVQISDVHVSHLNGEPQVARLVAQVQALEPHLIAVTGDLIDGSLEKLRSVAAPLAGLHAPLGVHYVTGNHEYFWGVDGWLKEFAAYGFDLLLNEYRLLTYKGAKLLVLGVNDPTGPRMGKEGPDLAKARSGAPNADFTLFLAHQPQAFALAKTANADLFLAGHTHGGQFFPFPPIVSLFHRYFRGLYKHDERLHIYIHSGSGFWGPPNRLGVAPEIALIELKRGPKGAH